MKKPALLIMAHQGRSYIKLLQKHLDELNVTCLVVSSIPRSDADLKLLQQHSEQVWVTDQHAITEDDLFSVLALAQKDYEILSVLATFEAYRLLMAKANATLGHTDADPQALALCMDKLACRQKLFALNLSKVDSRLIANEADLDALHKSQSAYFIKPRRGAGSFACFKLTPELNIKKLQELEQQMRHDKQFSAIFNGMFDFMAESYIHGDEYSFETIVLNDDAYVIGVHAKYLEESKGTTLEVSNSLPATTLSDEQQRSGEQFIRQCIRGLGLSQGAYHIETRFNAQSDEWEIIEINARMGGALINQSVETFTEGESILKLWVELLCTTQSQQRLADKLSALTESHRRAKALVKTGSVFISRYGEPGKTLLHFSAESIPTQPDIIDMPIPLGTQLPKSDRGIFLCNALWKVAIDDLANALTYLPTQFDEHIEVAYAD
ncbi:ATP-grasp domain-containing protein [Pseudoalteromonas umbrosa]|uniref:ATP-grasp domain-containing protein n=1 Tax=Pseudoalteromonas umbrosa TaxID=3048489 RepID=UPI0024C39680|nr:ATP-grasp domain-containing protein [Pseudoalteromonas sp. B95]MDK1290631.1 ATP-grasp domain-containing protein [Pseudoalteromonas sp. B95]